MPRVFIWRLRLEVGTGEFQEQSRSLERSLVDSGLRCICRQLIIRQCYRALKLRLGIILVLILRADSTIDQRLLPSAKPGGIDTV